MVLIGFKGAASLRLLPQDVEKNQNSVIVEVKNECTIDFF